MDLTNPKIINALLAKGGARLKKYLGQHFLISRKVLDRIMAAADLTTNDTVLEIGPGLGTLTLELARQAKKVIAVEQDRQLAGLLEKNLEIERLTDKVEIIKQDVLKLPIFNFQFSNAKFQSLNSRFKIVANLPYQITSPVLWKFLHEEKNKPELMVIMIQKEVAERLVAAAGDMSLLSVLAQFYADVEIVAQVKRTSFFPPPQVDSTVVRLRIRNYESGIQGKEKMFFKLVKVGFGHKRKMLKNNLAALNVPAAQIKRALKDAVIPEKARAQELSVDDWIKLQEMLYNENTENVKSKNH